MPSSTRMGSYNCCQMFGTVWFRAWSIKASFFTEYVLTLSIEHQVETCQFFKSWKIIKSGKQTKVTKVRRFQAKTKYSPFAFQISACQRNTLELVQRLIWTTIPTNVTLIIVNLEVTTSLIQDLAPRVTWITMPIKWIPITRHTIQAVETLLINLPVFYLRQNKRLWADGNF